MMTRWWIAGLFALGTACATQHKPGEAQDLNDFQEKQHADVGLCERAVDNYERVEFDSSTTPLGRKGLFDRNSYSFRHRDRVNSCTIKLSRRQARCIADAGSLQYVENCGRFPELQ